jgi:hypothetical protein
LGEQRWQKTRPHERQWWRRRTSEKAVPQPMHSGAMQSGIQGGGGSTQARRRSSCSSWIKKQNIFFEEY